MIMSWARFRELADWFSYTWSSTSSSRSKVRRVLGTPQRALLANNLQMKLYFDSNSMWWCNGLRRCGKLCDTCIVQLDHNAQFRRKLSNSQCIRQMCIQTFCTPILTTAQRLNQNWCESRLTRRDYKQKRRDIGGLRKTSLVHFVYVP